jgi:hypothetical protein
VVRLVVDNPRWFGYRLRDGSLYWRLAERMRREREAEARRALLGQQDQSTGTR